MIKRVSQKGFANIVLVVLIIILAGIVGYLALNNRKTSTPVSTPTPQIPTPTPIADGNPRATPEPQNGVLTVSLGQQFTLKKNGVAKIAGTGLEIEITQFFNSPCPTGAQCIWSGVGIGLEYRLNGEVKQGTNLVQAFGYQTTIIKTDNETYATVVVTKME